MISTFRGITRTLGRDNFSIGHKNMSEDILGMDLSSGIAAFEAKEFARAASLLGPLSEDGHPEAAYRMAIMCQNGLGMAVNETRALACMKSAAEQDMAIAQHGLGFMYMEGECVEKSAQDALNWFGKAAAQGLQGSMTTMAMMYEQGNGVDKDPEKAKALYKKAGFDNVPMS